MPTIPLRHTATRHWFLSSSRHRPHQVRYVGEPIAVVLAEAPEIAEDALGYIMSKSIPAGGGELPRRRKSSALLREDTGTTGPSLFRQRGDAQADFSGCYVRRKGFRPIATRQPRWNCAAPCRMERTGQSTDRQWCGKGPICHARILSKLIGLPLMQST